MIKDIALNEKLFLGCLMRSPHEIWRCRESITPDMFQGAVHRDIYEAMCRLADTGGRLSIPAILSHLPLEYDDLGPSSGIVMAMKEGAEDAGSPLDYAPPLAEQSAKRKLKTLSEWIAKATKGDDKNPEDIAHEALARLQAIMSSAMPIRPVQIGEAASRLLANSMTRGNEDAVPGLNTGIGPLDEILGRILGGDLGFILASQSDGKSALAAQIGMHAAQSGRPVLFVQMEMSDEVMAARELAAMTGVTVNEIHEGALDVWQAEKIADAARELRGAPFNILDCDEITVAQLKARAVYMQKSGGLGLIIIDQLDKIKTETKARSEFDRLAEVTRDLKKMAKALRVPVVVLAQRTRGAQRRDDPTPDILDADARSIERDADWVIGLWRLENWLQRNRPEAGREEEVNNWEVRKAKAKDLAEIIVLKRRRGKAFQQRKLKWIGEIMRFEELS